METPSSSLPYQYTTTVFPCPGVPYALIYARLLSACKLTNVTHTDTPAWGTFHWNFSKSIAKELLSESEQHACLAIGLTWYKYGRACKWKNGKLSVFHQHASVPRKCLAVMFIRDNSALL